MHSDFEEPTWELLYSSWKWKCKLLYEPILKNPDFVEIPVVSKNNNNYIEGVDWWPIETFDERKSIIKQNFYLKYWKLNVGTHKTAELLYELRNNPEGMAAVWIGAFLYDKIKNHPPEWRGHVYNCIGSAMRVVRKKIEGFGFVAWPPRSTQPLPVTIMNDYDLISVMNPNSYTSLMGLAAIENVLTRTTWVLIHYDSREKMLIKG